jgi:hypothetical protein
MAAYSIAQTTQAIRARFGPQDASVKLSELLFFLEGLNLPHIHTAPQGEPTQSSIESSATSSAHLKSQGQPVPHPLPQHQPQVHKGSKGATLHPIAAQKATETQKATYASIVKATSRLTSQKSKTKGTTSPLYVPERLKEAKEPLKPIRAYFKDSRDLEETLEALLARIASPQ